jgi:hypothetical protein
VILASEKGAIFAYTGMPVNVRKYGMWKSTSVKNTKNAKMQKITKI